MWKVLLLMSFCALWAGVNSDAAAMNLNKRSVSSFSGSYANSNGANEGYVGSYNDYDDYGYAPAFGFGFIDPYVFHQQLTAQILAQHAAQQKSLASTYSVGNSMVMAGASNLLNEIQDYKEFLNPHNFGYNHNARSQGPYRSSSGNIDRYAPNYSAAAASTGPNGGYQTAYISPENPSVPNISNRFASISPDGFKGVAVTSYSSSADIDGKRTSYRGAQTTINDNGHITTYKVNS